MRFRRFKRRANKDAELSITAFMNLMVILVPFLLITAVFSKISILELDLPSRSEMVKQNKKALQLEVVVRESSLRVQDRNRGVLKTIQNIESGYDVVSLNDYLQALKTKYQDMSLPPFVLSKRRSYPTMPNAKFPDKTPRIISSCL